VYKYIADLKSEQNLILKYANELINTYGLVGDGMGKLLLLKDSLIDYQNKNEDFLKETA